MLRARTREAVIMLAFLFEFFADQVLGLGRGALRGRVRRAPEPSRTGPPAAVLELHVYLFKFPSASSMSRSPWLSRPSATPRSSSGALSGAHGHHGGPRRRLRHKPPRDAAGDGSGLERGAYDKARRPRHAAMAGSSSAGTLPPTHLRTTARRRRAARASRCAKTGTCDVKRATPARHAINKRTRSDESTHNRGMTVAARDEKGKEIASGAKSLQIVYITGSRNDLCHEGEVASHARIPKDSIQIHAIGPAFAVDRSGSFLSEKRLDGTIKIYIDSSNEN